MVDGNLEIPESLEKEAREKKICDCSCTLRRDQHGKGCRQHAVSIPVSSWIPEIIQRH